MSYVISDLKTYYVVDEYVNAVRKVKLYGAFSLYQERGKVVSITDDIDGGFYSKIHPDKIIDTRVLLYKGFPVIIENNSVGAVKNKMINRRYVFSSELDAWKSILDRNAAKRTDIKYQLNKLNRADIKIRSKLNKLL